MHDAVCTVYYRRQKVQPQRSGWWRPKLFFCHVCSPLLFFEWLHVQHCYHWLQSGVSQDRPTSTFCLATRQRILIWKLERWRGRAGTLGISTVVVVFKLESTVSDNRFWIEMYNKWKNIHVSIDQWEPSQSCIHRDQGHPRLVKRYESAVCYQMAFNWLSVTSLLLRWQQHNDIINWVHNFLHYDPSVVVDLNRNPLSGILMACHSGSLLIFRAVRSRGEEKLWSCTLS